MLHHEGYVRRIDLINIAFAHFAHAETDAAFRHADLGNWAIEIQEGKSSHIAEMKGGLAGLQFRAGVFVDPDLVTNRDGAIHYRVAPIAFAAGL